MLSIYMLNSVNEYMLIYIYICEYIYMKYSECLQV